MIERKIESSAPESYSFEDEIDFKELCRVLWRCKWFVGGVTLLASVSAIIITLTLPKIYRAEALLSPVQSEADAVGSLASKYGGLASLAGISLPSAGGIDKTSLGIEKLKTRDFIFRFIKQHDLMIPLMAAEDWDPRTKKLVIDEDIYDIEAGDWVRTVEFPYQPEPSMQEAYKKFMEILSVAKNKDSDLVTVSIEHYSPQHAKQWVEWLVEDIDAFMREKDILDAERSIDYLNNQIAQTEVAEVRAMLSELVQGKTETLMLAKVRDQYLFEVIDPAIVPEKHSWPPILIIIVVSTLMGFMMSVVVVLFREVSAKRRRET